MDAIRPDLGAGVHEGLVVSAYEPAQRWIILLFISFYSGLMDVQRMTIAMAQRMSSEGHYDEGET